MKIVINDYFGRYGLSKAVYDELDMEWDNYGYGYEISRTDPKLIQAIEKIGCENASGYSARLKIIEIPDDVEYYIDDYDGIEEVHEIHRSWS